MFRSLGRFGSLNFGRLCLSRNSYLNVSYVSRLNMSRKSSVGCDDSREFSELMSLIMPLIADYIASNAKAETPVIQRRTPEQLIDIVPDIPDETSVNDSFDELRNAILTILEYSSRTGKAEYLDKLYCGSDAIGMTSALILAVLNQNVHVFDSAPVLSVIERKVISRICQVFYGHQCTDTRGGVMVPGGSYGCMLALRTARDKRYPEFKQKGMTQCNKIPTIIASASMHYCIMTAAETLGIGSENVISVDCNHKDGSMNVDELKKTINECKRNNRDPFVVTCMAGTTVFGAFDDFTRIWNEVCEPNNIWMHIDACWGGNAAFSSQQELRHKMEGAQFADSISWDAHKLFSVPILCSALCVKNEMELIRTCTPPNADYLFHSNSNDSRFLFDFGLKTLQCGRSGDALKLYLTWLHYGVNGLNDRVDHAVKNARKLAQLIDDDNELELVQYSVNDIAYANVCFWFVGSDHLRQKVIEWKSVDKRYRIESKEDQLLFDRLHALTKSIHSFVRESGEITMDYSPLPALNLPNFFRPILTNHRIMTVDQLKHILDVVKRAAKKADAQAI